MPNAKPDWAAFSESVLANHMQRVKNALTDQGYIVRRLLPARFSSAHRERVSIQLPHDGRAVHVESVLNVNPHAKHGLKGGLSFVIDGIKDKHLATIAKSDELKFGALPLNIDAAQVMLEQTLTAQFSPEHIAQLVSQTLTH